MPRSAAVDAALIRPFGRTIASSSAQSARARWSLRTSASLRDRATIVAEWLPGRPEKRSSRRPAAAHARSSRTGISTRSDGAFATRSAIAPRSPRATAVWNALPPSVLLRARHSTLILERSGRSGEAGSEAVVRTCGHTAFGDLTEARRRCQRQHESAKNVPTSLNLKLPNMLTLQFPPSPADMSPGKCFRQRGDVT